MTTIASFESGDGLSRKFLIFLCMIKTTIIPHFSSQCIIKYGAQNHRIMPHKKWFSSIIFSRTLLVYLTSQNHIPYGTRTDVPVHRHYVMRRIGIEGIWEYLRVTRFIKCDDVHERLN